MPTLVGQACMCLPCLGCAWVKTTPSGAAAGEEGKKREREREKMKRPAFPYNKPRGEKVEEKEEEGEGEEKKVTSGKLHSSATVQFFFVCVLCTNAVQLEK